MYIFDVHVFLYLLYVFNSFFSCLVFPSVFTSGSMAGLPNPGKSICMYVCMFFYIGFHGWSSQPRKIHMYVCMPRNVNTVCMRALQACMYLCTSVCLSVCLSVCMYACMTPTHSWIRAGATMRVARTRSNFIFCIHTTKFYRGKTIACPRWKWACIYRSTQRFTCDAPEPNACTHTHLVNTVPVAVSDI